MTQPLFNSAQFRRALGAFTTGVTIVTARGSSGELAGVTANSFSSVSLDPPLVLWSLAKSAYSRPTYCESEYFAIHILAASQEALSNRFASRGQDKFADTAFEEGIGGTPLLAGCSARFQCKVVHQYEGGDHIIFVGEVVDLVESNEVPLAYHGGKYAIAALKTSKKLVESADESSFSEDFIGYLLWRCYFQFLAAMRQRESLSAYTDQEFLVLITLLYNNWRSADSLAFKTLRSGGGADDFEHAVTPLCEKGLVEEMLDDKGVKLYGLNEAGRALALQLATEAKSVEDDLLERLGVGESMVLRNLLKSFILESNAEFPFPLHPTAEVV